MKKLFLVGFILSQLSLQVFGQAIDFRNNNLAFSGSTLVDASKLVRDINGVALTGSNWKAVLYVGMSDETLSFVTGSTSSFRDEPTSFDGTWQGGTKVLTGFSEGNTVRVQVKVYDGASYSSFEDAVAQGGIVGSSSTFSYTIPTTGASSSSYFMSNFSGFQLAAVPEPTTVALGVLGGLGLLARRRRNAKV